MKKFPNVVCHLAAQQFLQKHSLGTGHRQKWPALHRISRATETTQILHLYRDLSDIFLQAKPAGFSSCQICLKKRKKKLHSLLKSIKKKLQNWPPLKIMLYYVLFEYSYLQSTSTRCQFRDLKTYF